jgi:hypothetical protein
VEDQVLYEFLNEEQDKHDKRCLAWEIQASGILALDGFVFEYMC